MFSKFEEKNFKTFRQSFNTIFKQKRISHDLKLSQIVIIALKDNPACEAYANMGFIIDK